MSFKRSVLKQGLRLVTERQSWARSVSVGVFVDRGTRDEPSNLSGAAHFIEHMVFKGTRSKSALEISKSLERLGGELNAYTSREETCFHANCLKEHLPVALDVLLDLVHNAEFAAKSFRREKEVIQQELLMTRDDAEEYVYDVFYESTYPGSAMGRPILGTEESLKTMSRSGLFEFYKKHYGPENIVVSIVGDIDHEGALELIERHLRARRGGASQSHRRSVRRKPKAKGFTQFVNREMEQCHLLFGLTSPSAKDSERFASYILNAALGGGMTSRLYQKVREQRGLCYSIYSSVHPSSDSGLLTVYVGTTPEHFGRVSDIVLAELESLSEGKLSPSELKGFRQQVVGEVWLESESLENRMQSLGAQELLFRKHRALADIVKDIEEVTLKDVQRCARKFFDLDQMGMVVIGQAEDLEHELEKLGV